MHTVGKGKAKTLFNGAGLLAQQVKGNAQGTRAPVDRALIGDCPERSIFGIVNHLKKRNV